MLFTVDNECPSQPLRVVALQDVEHLAGQAQPRRRVGPALARLEVDQQGQRLLAGRHDVDDPLQHEDEVLHLPRARVRVLPARVQVVAHPPLLVVAQDDLLARLVLGRDVVRRQALDAVLAPPGQRLEQPFLGLLWLPLGRPQEAQQALARQPEPLAVGDGPRGLFAGDLGP